MNKNNLLEILKGLIGIAVLLLLFQASKYVIYALSIVFFYATDFLGSPLITIALGVLCLVGFAILTGLGKATGETFGANKVSLVFKTIFPKKKFFYMPTWVLIMLCGLCLFSVLYNLYMSINFESLTTVTINGVQIDPKAPEYRLVIEDAKKSHMVAAVFTAILSGIFGWLAFKRKKCDTNS